MLLPILTIADQIALYYVRPTNSGKAIIMFNRKRVRKMTTYKVNLQKELNGTAFVIVSTVLETTDKKVWWDKINQYRKKHFIDILETTATVNV